jgi:multisubunit Na+/H+ antiporter MnhC subunit
MKKRVLWQWMIILTAATLFVAGIYLKQRNNNLVKENQHLILINDSVLSVNLELGKNVAQMQRLLDSLQTATSKQRLLTFH